jgi:hypothetical protein
MNKKHVLDVGKESFLGPEVIPYHVSSSLGNHKVFLGSLIFSHPSGSSNILREYEDKLSSIRGSPIQRWIHQDCVHSLQQDFFPPTHLHELLSMINYMLTYAYDYFMLDLSLLYYMIKHRGRYLDEMISWLHWLYDFT